MKHLLVSFFFFLLCCTVTEAQNYTNISGPENVLVVYNDLDNISLSVANYYKDARNIPEENLLALNLPTTFIIENHTIRLIDHNEVIKDDDGNNNEDPNSIYNNTLQYVKQFITQPIEDYLNNTIVNGESLADKIRFIVVCKGVPFKATSWVVDFSHVTDLSRRGVSVDALISIINQSDPNFSITNSSFISSSYASSTYKNPYHGIEEADGVDYNFNYRFKTKTYVNSSGIELNYLVSRLDGYDYTDVAAMIDKSVSTDMSGESVFVLDGDLTSYTGLNVSACRLDVILANQNLNDLNFLSDENESDVVILSTNNNCIGYESSGSHSDALLYADYCVDVLEFNYSNGAIFNTYESFNRYAFDISNLGDNEENFGKRGGHVFPTFTHYQGLIADFIHAGGTGGEAHVYEPTTATVSDGEYFFPAYAMGYSLVEAIYMGIPYLAYRNLVVGDPLTTIAWGKQTTTKNISMSGTNLITDILTIQTGDTLTFTSGAHINLKHHGFVTGSGTLQVESNVIISSTDWQRALLLAAENDHPKLVWSTNPNMTPFTKYRIYRKIDTNPLKLIDSTTYQYYLDNTLVFSDPEGGIGKFVQYYVVSVNNTTYSEPSNTVSGIFNKSQAGKIIAPQTQLVGNYNL